MLIDTFENKEKIINNLLEIVAFEGWSNDSLKLAFNKANIDEKYLTLIFENKIFSAIEFITQIRCQKLKELAENSADFSHKKIHQKISFLVFNFLNIDNNNKLSLRRLINFYLDPRNIIDCNDKGLKPSYQALKEAYLVADFMWKLCGDNSSDINFFSKRLILSKIIIRSFIFYANDESANSEASRRMIDEQISQVLKFAKIKKISKEKFELFKNKLDEIFVDQNNQIKSPKDLIKDLPFFRLIKKNFR